MWLTHGLIHPGLLTLWTDLPDSDEEEPDVQAALKDPSDNDWAPYPNKTVCSGCTPPWQCCCDSPLLYSFIQMFLLDMLDNLPRLRMSDKHLEAVLFVMKESGARSVPSLDTLRRFQKSLREDMPTQMTTRHQSAEGNLFYTHSIIGQVQNVSDPPSMFELVIN